jgi:hypothetical protein
LYLNGNFTGDDKNKEKAAALAKRDWLPAALKREVMMHCYKSAGTAPTTDNARDMEAFSKACESLFPKVEYMRVTFNSTRWQICY